MRILKILSLAAFGFLGVAPLSVQAVNNEAAAENVQPQAQFSKGTVIIRAPLNERGQMNTDAAEMRYFPIRISKNVHPQQLLQIWAQGQQLQYQPNAARPEVDQGTTDDQVQLEQRWRGGRWGGWGGRWGGWGGRWWGGRWGGWGGFGWRRPFFYGGFNPYYYGGYGYYGYSPYFYYPYAGYGYFTYC